MAHIQVHVQVLVSFQNVVHGNIYITLLCGMFDEIPTCSCCPSANPPPSLLSPTLLQYLHRTHIFCACPSWIIFANKDKVLPFFLHFLLQNLISAPSFWCLCVYLYILYEVFIFILKWMILLGNRTFTSLIWNVFAQVCFKWVQFELFKTRKCKLIPYWTSKRFDCLLIIHVYWKIILFQSSNWTNHLDIHIYNY